MYRPSGKKNLLSSNISSTCLHNMVNLGPLAAEIVSLVWGTPGNFNSSRLGSVTAWHSSSGHQPNFVALNRGHHLYLAGRPSRWASVKINKTVVVSCMSRLTTMQTVIQTVSINNQLLKTVTDENCVLVRG